MTPLTKASDLPAAPVVKVKITVTNQIQNWTAYNPVFPEYHENKSRRKLYP